MKSRDHVRPPAGRQLPPVPRRTPQNRRDANDYVAEHNIRGLMMDLTQKVLLHMPPNPREFLQASLAGENGAGNSGEGERVEAGSRGDAFQISVHAECSGVGLTTQRSSVSRLLSKRNKVEQLRTQVETYDMMCSMLSGAADSASAGSGGAQDQSGAEMLLMMKTLKEELTRTREGAAKEREELRRTREGAAKEREELRRGIEELQRQEKSTQAEVRRLVDEETMHFKVEMAALKDTKRELMKRGLIPWEDDNDGTRLPGQWVNVRIFISSSFIDTQAERDMIVQSILPKLNHELAKNFVRVTFVDLRWGVASHESANCEAIQCTCLNEIERCVEISPTGSHPCPSYPFFVCLRTKRKGWVMDTVNKPEAFEKPERFAWIADEDLGVHDKKLSITELEIYHGLLGRREDNQDCKRVFVYFRDDQEFITEVDHDMRWIFEFEHISEEDVQTRGIADSVKVQYAVTPEAPLRRRDYDEVDKLIRKRAGDASSPALVRTYTPTGATTRITGQMPGANGKKFGVGHVTGLQDLERQIYIDLFEAINSQYPKPHRQLNAMALEDMYHQHHITSSKACFGRDDLLCNMMDLLAPGSGVRCPVAVVGLPGSGKTTVMAAFIKRLLEQGEREKDLVVFFHVVASSPQSFSVKNVLTRLCEFLKKRCDLSLEVPTTMAALRDSWMHFVLMAAQKYKVVIVLDAINQLSSEHDALSLSWLPTSLPKDSNIRIVCSMIDKDQQHETMKQRQPETVKTQIAVKPMQRVDQERLVAAFLGLLHKSLTAKQMEMLLNKEDAGSPLYLTTACHRLIELGIYEEMDDEIAKLPGRKIPLLEKIIDSMIGKFGKGVIRSTLLFVYFSQGGIFEHELLHLVSQEVERMKRGEAKATCQGGGMSNEGTRLDEFSFSLLYQRLQPLLPTTASGLLQFFHNDMRTLIFKLFLGGEGKDFSHLGEEHQQKQFELQTEEEKQESLRYNRILAEYYLKQVEEEGNHELRTIQSLTAHMVNANMIDELRQFLLLPRVFKVMFSSDLRIEFLSLWGQCFSSRDDKRRDSAAAVPSQVPLPDPQVEGRDDDDARVAKMFRDLDINGDGGISIREFKHFALRLGLANDTIDEEFVKLDADGDGEICESEFRAFFRDKRQGMTTVEYDAFLKQVDQGRVEFISDTGDGPKNLAQWYRESLASDANDIYDPAEEAQVFCLLGDFFLLKGDEAQGLTLDSAESESFYKQALVLDPKATPALIGLSRLERDRKQSDKAMAYLREAMGYLQNFHGYRHIEVARCQRDMAGVCLMEDDFQTAKQVIVKARKIVTEVCGKQSLEYADFMMSEGDVLVDIASKTADTGSKNQAQHKLWKDSIAAYREAIGQQKLVMGEKHPAVLTSYDRLIAHVMEQPGMLTEDVVAEFAKPRVEMELSMSGTLQRASAFEWLQMLVQVHAAHQLQESVSSEVAPKDDTESRVATSLWYNDVDAESRALKAVETQPVEMTEAVKASATMIKPAHNKSLALQVRAGTDALELGEVDGSDNQLWLWHGEEVQHVATGLFLDAEVKYMYVAELGAPWESCGIRLCVRPRALGLTVVRAWYGGPHNHPGKIYDIRESASWLWQTGTKKGKDVTEIVRAAMRSDGSLDFNRERRGCNEIFNFGGDWSCCKILAVEYRYGAGSVKTWFSQSVPHEPHACFLPASDDRQCWTAMADVKPMILVERGSGDQCIFNESDKLKNGSTISLTMQSHADTGIGKQYADERRAGPWRYIESGGCSQETSIRVRYEDGNYIKLADDDLVFDVLHWKMEAGNTVNFVGGTTDDEKTKKEGGGRDWIINDDGTISAKHHPHLVLGMAKGVVIRHVVGGQALDVNFWRLEKGAGVNLNAPTQVGKKSVAWVVECLDGTEKQPAPVEPHPTSSGQQHEPRAAIADIPEGAEFYIKPAANPKRCLSVRSNGYTKDPFEVYLTNVDPSSKRQKWRLVDGDTFQNVESGQFLHSATKYAMITDIDKIWEGDNHTDLVTRPQDFSDAQRWVLGPDEFFGGQVLRHYKDGRGVEIHGWKVDDGADVGCENAVYSACKGSSYILEGENFSTLNTKPGRKLRLALRDGRGLALEHADVDASQGHRAYHIRMTSAAKAIEVEFKSNGAIVVTAGHHHLGFTLDLWGGTRKLGNRQHFSDCHGHHQWQLNADDGTISPRGARHLVLGWREHVQLVKRGDAAQLQFIRPGNEGRDDKGSFLSDQSDALVDTLSVKTTSEFRAEMLSKMLCIFLETPKVAKAAAAALRLLEVHGAKITDEVRDGLKLAYVDYDACKTPGCPFKRNMDPRYRRVKDPIWHDYCCEACGHSSSELHGGLCQKQEVECPERMEALVLDTSISCQQLVSALCDRDEVIRAAVQSPGMLLAALKTTKTADAALQLLEVHGAKITDEVRDGLLVKDPKKQPMSMLERLIHDDKCAGLVKALCARDAAIKASVVS